MSRRKSPRIYVPSRRDVLRYGGLGAIGAAAGVGASGCPSEEAVAPPGETIGWGVPVDNLSGRALLEPELRPEGILELFLFGGLSPWDTLYTVPAWGDPELGEYPEPWMMHAFRDGGPDSLDAWFETCTGNKELLVHPFGVDELGTQVNLGPFLYPMWERPDVLARTRLIVLKHDEAAHQGACPLTMCGLPRNNPRMAGTASHLERFFREHGDPDRLTPHTYVLYPYLDDLTLLNGDAASAIGLHRASVRPMTFRMTPTGLDSAQLLREHVGDRREAVDDAVRLYLDRYRARLRTAGENGAAVRSAGFSDFSVARGNLERSAEILELLSTEAVAGATGSECGYDSDADYTVMQLRLATELLTRSVEPAKYVHVVDGGLLPADGGGAYDTHVSHIRDGGRNTAQMARELMARINEPGENDPSKLDLDRHMILLTTEFGRAPFRGGDGLDHWPTAYVHAIIGGPVGEDQAGILGAINEEAVAHASVSPSDFRAALLLTQGVWPFEAESFAVSDVSEGTDERDAAAWLREHLLGHPIA